MLNELNTNYWKLLLYNWYTTSSSHLNILALFTNTLHVILANNFWIFAAFSFQFIVQFLPFKLIIISTSNIFHTDVTTTSICCWKISGFIYLNTQNLAHFVDKNVRKVRRVLIAALHMGGTNNFPKVWVNSNEDSVAGSSARQGWQLLNFKSQDGDTFRGGDDFRQSSRGDCFIMTNCWYFHQMLHLEFYKFRLRRYFLLF